MRLMQRPIVGEERFEVVVDMGLLDNLLQEATLSDGLVFENFRIGQEPFEMGFQRAPKRLQVEPPRIDQCAVEIKQHPRLNGRSQSASWGVPQSFSILRR